MKGLLTLLLSFFFVLFNPSQSYSQDDTGSFGIRGGVGTDINLGLGYGFGVNYIFPVSNFELSVVFFGHHSEETTEEFNTYNETTDLFVYGVMGNYLFGYRHKEPGLFGIVGFGFCAVSLDWEESSPDDNSLGTPLPGGGSKQSESGTGGGTILNVGFGYSFGELNLRAEFPVIVAFAAPGDASSVAPTFMVTLGYNF
jgi:hypothetical protein